MKHLVTVFSSITLAQNCRDILRWKPWGCNTGAVFKYLSKEYFNHTELSKLTDRVWNLHSWHLAHSLLHLSMLHTCSTALQTLSQSARHRFNHCLYETHGVSRRELWSCYAAGTVLLHPSSAWLCGLSSANRPDPPFHNLACSLSYAGREETRDVWLRLGCNFLTQTHASNKIIDPFARRRAFKCNSRWTRASVSGSYYHLIFL